MANSGRKDNDERRAENGHVDVLVLARISKSLTNCPRRPVFALDPFEFFLLIRHSDIAFQAPEKQKHHLCRRHYS